MVKPKESPAITVLIVACVCGSVISKEANATKTGLRFEPDREALPWRSDRGGEPRGPVRPTHTARVHIRTPVGRNSRPAKLPAGDEGILEMLKTAPGRSLSEQQRRFLSASDAMFRHVTRRMKNHDTFFLYAVSADDARKMVEALLAVGRGNAEAEVEAAKTRLRTLEDQAARIRKELPPKEAALATVTVEYEKAKKETHSPSIDSDAAKESKEIILEMNTILDSLAIEIAGIEAKLAAVERLKSQNRPGSPEGLARLEDMVNEQSVELASALAKQKAATDIREREEKSYALYNNRVSLSKQVGKLRNDLRNAEANLRTVTRLLANPEPYMRPPQVYLNRATIHPTKTK